jgi:hypothetical protein
VNLYVAEDVPDAHRRRVAYRNGRKISLAKQEHRVERGGVWLL